VLGLATQTTRTSTQLITTQSASTVAAMLSTLTTAPASVQVAAVQSWYKFQDKESICNFASLQSEMHKNYTLIILLTFSVTNLYDPVFAAEINIFCHECMGKNLYLLSF
jgi:hypothetical protein